VQAEDEHGDREATGGGDQQRRPGRRGQTAIALLGVLQRGGERDRTDRQIRYAGSHRHARAQRQQPDRGAGDE
jgi:hypothetical protein